jgi:outer membrane usher protein
MHTRMSHHRHTSTPGPTAAIRDPGLGLPYAPSLGHSASGSLQSDAHPPETAVKEAAVDEPAVNKVPQAASAETPVWFDVEINAQHVGTALLLRDSKGRMSVAREDLERWRLRVPQVQPLLDQGAAFYPLSAFPGLTYSIDDATQSISIRAPAEIFLETSIGAAHTRVAMPVRSSPGAFFNYDVVVAHSTGAGFAERTANGLFEVGAFSRWGTATTTFVGSDSAGDSTLVRLDATLTQDRPEALASLRIGDSISGVSSWGGGVHFGGVQWSTDFTTQPGFITTPLAGVHGEAVLPSTIDLYINNALNLETSVSPGPFTINNLPLISGQGEARLVVRNILGQEQQINTPFYASPVLLRSGLSSFSYEIGAARVDYGLQSNNYGRSLAIASHRYGFTDSFTGELHAELLREQQTAGLGGDWLVHGFAVVNAAVSASHSARGDGELLQLGLSRQSRTFSFGASATLESADYVQVGMLPDQLAPIRVLQGFVAMPMVARGSLSLNYVQDDYRDQSPAHLLSSQLSWPIGRNGFLGIYAVKPLRGGEGPVVGMNFIYSLGVRTSVSSSMTRQGGGTQDQAQVQQSLPAGRGFGYRVAVGANGGDLWDATLGYQNDIGTYTLHSVRNQGQSSTSAEAQGGVALLDGEAFLTRRMDESFAVVRVGDFPNVHIYADNQEVGMTDSRGMALVPRIRAYDHNPLRVEQADLPLDVDIDTLERDAVPYRFSGVLVNFDIRRSFGALLALTLDDGTPVPAGATATIAGSDTEFPVGMHGEVYLSGLSKSSAVRVSWAGRACELTVAFLPSANPMPRLGPYMCQQDSL